MITIHQSINGDKEGSYALLATSMENTQEAKRICNTTDMRARPGEGIEWSPALRGFSYDNYYLILKTFKDSTPGVRIGRIFSHALIIEKKDLPFIIDLNKILELLPEQANKTVQLHPIQVESNNSVCGGEIECFSREAKAINALLHYSDYKNTIVWVGREGFTELISQVWQSVGGNVRGKINFDIAFNPREIDTHRLNIICVPHSVLAQWNNTGFCIINTTDREELATTAAFYLGGHDKGKAMRGLLKDLDVEPENLGDYTYFEDVANGLENLQSIISLRSVLPLAALLSKISSNKLKGQTIKTNVLNKILTLIPNAMGQEIVGLHNVDWEGFSEASAQIVPALQLWLNKKLMINKEDSLPVIKKAVDQKVSWWYKEVEASISKQLNNWEHSYAPLIWSWIQEQSTILNYIGNYIPTSSQVEVDFVETCPLTINPSELINELIRFCLQRKWLTLHGILLLKNYSHVEAIRRQLQVDQQMDNLASLKRITQDIPDDELIAIALQDIDSRVTKIMGERIASNSKTLAGLDVGNSVWRQLWMESMNYAHDPWEGIEEPQSILFQLLNQIIIGDKVELALLQKLSQTQWADLTDYPSRPKIWNMLPTEVRGTFLKSTAIKIIRQLSEGEIAIAGLEHELKTVMASQNVFSTVIENNGYTTLFKLQLFIQITDLSEDIFIRLILKQSLLYDESVTAGQIIRSKNWREAAHKIADIIAFRADLEPALWECKHLLSFFTKVTLQWNGHLKNNTISRDDWWAEFTRLCIQLYPRGPMDRGIWILADGEEYDLINCGSGQEIWVNAINRLRQQSFKKVNVEKLLKMMVSENQQNNKLETLLKLYQRL